MIVDDDTILCGALTRLLEDNGYHPLQPVNSYDDAKKQLFETEPDLALVDIGLAGNKDGIQLASYFYLHSQVPVIFITGHTDSVTLQRAKKSHPSSLVLKAKPILNEKSLIEAIGQQLLASILMAVPDEASPIKIKPKGLLIKVIEQRIQPIKSSRSKRFDKGKKTNLDTLIPFDDIEIIYANNDTVRNTVVLRPIGKIEYVHRESLTGIAKKLPDYFARITDYQIINIKKVTHCIDDSVLFINDDRYDVSAKYQPLAHEKKRIYIGN